MDNKKQSLASRIPPKVWLLISFAVAMLVWYLMSIIPQTSRAFPNVVVTIEGLMRMVERGAFWQDLSSSLISVALGYAIGFVIALPVAILMAWYVPVRNILEPWIQFIRNIPPLAYVPLIVICAGVGRLPQVIVITIACFLTMCVTIYQPAKVSPEKWQRLSVFVEDAITTGFRPIILVPATPDMMDSILSEAGVDANSMLRFDEIMYFADFKTVISVNRSNCGITYFHRGYLVKKWPYSSIPDYADLAELASGDATETLLVSDTAGNLTFQGFLLYSFAVMLLL